MGGSSHMGSDEDKKKLNDDVVEFVCKRTGTEVPRLAARLKSYVDLQHKRQRAVAARRNYYNKKDYSTARKKTERDQKDKTMENTDQPADDNDRDRVRRRHGGETRSRSEGPYDRCGRRRRRRRRRRSCRRRRRRRCGRRRRRRRSCKRRRRRRRKRSCSRRRRRRSCHRRRRRRRRRC